MKWLKIFKCNVQASLLNLSLFGSILKYEIENTINRGCDDNIIAILTKKRVKLSTAHENPR